MNQALSKTLLIGGIAWFLYQFGELLTQHSEWSYLSTTAGVGEVFKLGASVILSVIGALGTNMKKPTPDNVVDIATRRDAG